jgi:hypothetical protein
MGFDPIKSLETLYGADIMQDNMHEARVRILKYLKEIGVEITIYLIKLVLKNFFCTPLDKYKNGSLDYDFEFNHEIQEDEVERLSKEINEISHDNTEPTI